MSFPKFLSGHLSMFGIEFAHSFICLCNRRMVCDFHSWAQMIGFPIFYSYSLISNHMLPFVRLNIANLTTDFKSAITIPSSGLLFLLEWINAPQVTKMCPDDLFPPLQNLDIGLVTVSILKRVFGAYGALLKDCLTTLIYPCIVDFRGVFASLYLSFRCVCLFNPTLVLHRTVLIPLAAGKLHSSQVYLLPDDMVTETVII